MYNSMFFGSLSTNDYNIDYATEGFLVGESYNSIKYPDMISGQDEDYMDTSNIQQTLQHDTSQWQRLSNAECISAYAVDLISSRRDLVVVVPKPNTTNSSLLYRDAYHFELKAKLVDDTYGPYQWICEDPELFAKLTANGWDWSHFEPGRDGSRYVLAPMLKKIADEWSPHYYDAQYCMSEIVVGKCSLNFSLAIAVVIMVCNVVKICCMAYVACGIKDSPLITVGDAVASFIQRADGATKDACLVDGEWFRRHWNDSYSSDVHREEILGAEPKVFNGESHRIRDAASSGRWLGLVGLLSIALVTIAGLLAYGVKHLKTSDKSLAALWAMGIDTVREESLIGGSVWHMPSVTSAVVVANLPQVILSFVYLLFNSVLTAMLAAREWSHYARHRKPLRVSTPKGLQRSTYFLSLPYRFAIPLLLLSGALHWLVSQSLFLASITTELRDGRSMAEDTVSTCGYSPLAMILTLGIGTIMLAGIIFGGYWSVSTGIPLVGSCSAAVSAACHLPREEDEAHLLPLRWGVVVAQMDGGNIGHCSFSTKEVVGPVVGAKYA
ncbi:hypothetical protein E4T43_02765 [Aureobasidium subglaciale]|nr:hypothetical protein E4T43_02765 [Aureobasidium subglaciale]